MKILFASDIHGSASAMEKVIARFQADTCDRMILLGDLLYHGPRNDFPDRYDPKAVTALLNGFQPVPFCVRGNCDAEVDQMMLNFPIRSDSMLLPLKDGRCAFITHGHLYHTECPPPHKKGDVLIHGHTHVHGVWEMGDYTYINPGSAALPKEGQKASYMLLEDGVFSIRDLEDGTEMLRWCL